MTYRHKVTFDYFDALYFASNCSSRTETLFIVDLVQSLQLEKLAFKASTAVGDIHDTG
jgi:hypothetical protein